MGELIHSFVIFCFLLLPFFLLEGVIKKLNKVIFFLFFGILFLVAIYGAVSSFIEASKSEDPKVLRAKWETKHFAAVSASNELKYRFQNHLCPICGKPAKWYWDGTEDDNLKVISTTDLKPGEEKENDEFACENHTDFLKLLQNGTDKEVKNYFDSHYQGSGQSEISMASREGPVIDGEEEKLEGAYENGISWFIAFVGLGVILFLNLIKTIFSK